MNIEYVKTKIEDIKEDSIHWKITSSDMKVGNSKFTNYRACPYVVTEKGKESPLIIETSKVFSFGIREFDNEGGKSYSFSLSLVDRKQPSAYEKAFVKACDIISASGRKFLLANQNKFKKDWVESDLRKVNILWRNNKDEEDRPVLYAKLPTRKGDFTCSFSKPYYPKDKDGNYLKDREGKKVISLKQIDPLLFRGTTCLTKATIRIESIFVGSKIVSFQTKLENAVIFPMIRKSIAVSITEEDMEGLEEEEEEKQQEETEEEVSEDAEEEVKEETEEPNPSRFSISEPVEEPVKVTKSPQAAAPIQEEEDLKPRKRLPRKKN